MEASVLILAYALISVVSSSPVFVNNFNASVAVNETDLPPKIVQKIIGGYYVDIEDYPYQVAFRHRARFLAFCGGSIINAKWILTAAHCFRDEAELPDMEVVFGSTYLGDGPGAILPIRKVIIHPNYDPTEKMSPYDIALVKVPGNLIRKTRQFQSAAIELSDDLENVQPGQMGIVSGYGLDQMNAEQPQLYLKATEIPIRRDSVCQDLYNGSNEIAPFQANIEICAGFPMGGDDTCKGDSGGPMVVNTENGKVLVGITSSGIGCGVRYAPGRYTYVTAFIKWIHAVIRMH
jgi:secreted trypsin-like serine protease